MKQNEIDDYLSQLSEMNKVLLKLMEMNKDEDHIYIKMQINSVKEELIIRLLADWYDRHGLDTTT